jgi:DNA replication protein DnaC
MSGQKIKQEVEQYLRELRLSAVRESYKDIAESAEKEESGYVEYLLELLKTECEVRGQKRIERRLRESRLPLEKNLESFDLKRFPKKLLRQVKVLQDGSFLNHLAIPAAGRHIYYVLSDRN